MRIENFQVVGNARPHGYTDEMILSDVRSFGVEVEKIFGPAVNEWSIGGVRFDPKANQPCLWYPYGLQGVVMVNLDRNATTSIEFSRFQLAHEMVHCINPSGGNSANVLEEGMAAWFQQSYATKKLKGFVQLGDKKYIEARKLFNKFVKKSKVANPIARIRKVEPYLHKVTHETFVATGIALPADLEEVLLSKFENFAG